MNTSQIKIKITTIGDDGCGVKISATDSEAFSYAIQELKEIIPAEFRNYDPTKKTWMINNWDCLNVWLDELRRSYDIETEFSSEQANRQPPPPPKQNLTSPYQTLYLLPNAPPEVIKATYKALAKIHHPDANGNNEKMIQINPAFEIITQENNGDGVR
jgi:hypothetical protein